MLPKVVESGVVPNFTTAPSMKLLPVRVKVSPEPPLVAMFGATVVSAGAGLLTVKVKGAVVPPPGPGFVTVTDFVPAAVISDAAISSVKCAESLTTTSAE